MATATTQQLRPVLTVLSHRHTLPLEAMLVAGPAAGCMLAQCQAGTQGLHPPPWTPSDLPLGSGSSCRCLSPSGCTTTHCLHLLTRVTQSMHGICWAPQTDGPGTCLISKPFRTSAEVSDTCSMLWGACCHAVAYEAHTTHGHTILHTVGAVLLLVAGVWRYLPLSVPIAATYFRLVASEVRGNATFQRRAALAELEVGACIINRNANLDSASTLIGCLYNQDTCHTLTLLQDSKWCISHAADSWIQHNTAKLCHMPKAPSRWNLRGESILQLNPALLLWYNSAAGLQPVCV
jgi:hypothetical protein